MHKMKTILSPFAYSDPPVPATLLAVPPMPSKLLGPQAIDRTRLIHFQEEKIADNMLDFKQLALQAHDVTAMKGNLSTIKEKVVKCEWLYQVVL